MARELEFEAEVISAGNAKKTVTIKLGSKAVTALVNSATPLALNGDKKTEIAAGVYSDIHKTLDDIHSRTDQLVRNYLLIVGAIISVYLGGGGNLDSAILWLVPAVLAVGGVQIYFMLGITCQFRTQQEKILASIGQQVPSASSLFQIEKAPTQAAFGDFRCWGMLYVAAIAAILVFFKHEALNDQLFENEKSSPSASYSPDIPQDASNVTLSYNDPANTTVTLQCAIDGDRAMTCQ